MPTQAPLTHETDAVASFEAAIAVMGESDARLANVASLFFSEESISVDGAE